MKKKEAQKKLISIKAQIKKFFEKYLPTIKVDVYPPDESILKSEALAVPDRSISKLNIFENEKPKGTKFETYEITVVLFNADTQKTVEVTYYLIKSPNEQYHTNRNDYSSLWAVVDGEENFTNSHEDQNSLLELVKSKLGVGFKYTYVVGDGDGDSEEFGLDQFYWIKRGVAGAVETYKKLREISNDAYIAIRQYGDFEDTDDAFKEYGVGEMDLPMSELIKSDPNLSDSLKEDARKIEFLSTQVVLTNAEKLVGRQLPLRFGEMERKHYERDTFEVDLMESVTISPNEAYIDSQTDDHDDYYGMQADIFSDIVNSKNLLIESKIPQPTLVDYVVHVDEDSNSVVVEAYHKITVEAKDMDHAKKEAALHGSFVKSSLPKYYPLMAANMNDDEFEKSRYPLMKHFKNKISVDNNGIAKISIQDIRQIYPLKVEKEQFFSQKVKYKKSKDFDNTGGWITTIDDEKYEIFRDMSNKWWYATPATARKLGRDDKKHLGFTKKEATAKLLELIWESKHAE